MMSTTLFSGAQSEARMTQFLLETPSRLSMAAPPAKPQLWQLQNSIAPIARNPTTLTKTENDESKDDFMLNSDLTDDVFFRHYAARVGSKANKIEPFPLKLYRIIFEAEKNGDDDIISFCPSGKSFMIHKVDDFVEHIMPKYFASNRITSFQRQLNLYGFNKVLRGADKGGFAHSSFVKNQRNLCLTIKRKVQTFKVPPHFLTTETATPKATVPCPSPTGMSTGHGSPPLKPVAAPTPTRRVSASTPSSQLPSTPSSLGNSAVFGGFPTLPSLMMSADLGGSYRSSDITSHLLSSRTSELLQLNQKIMLAKERAAMEQQLALVAIHRLVNRVNL